VDGSDRSVVDYYENGAWHRWSPGGSPTLAGDGEFRADGPLTLSTPSGQAVYRGRLRAATVSSPGSRETVNVLGLDAYVRGVVASEMPASWHAEAVQSQAVAARTYAAQNRVENAGEPYQICDTSACQVYRGVNGENPDSDAAVRATAHQILRYGGAPAFAQFSSSNGGWSTDGGFPYLVAKADPYDDVSINPNHTWSQPLRVRAIENAYPRLGKLRRIRVTARDGHGQWQGRVLSMVLVGSRNNVSLSGDAFRSTFGLKSTWFSF
jgi:SpoIID/LytB domain protein